MTFALVVIGISEFSGTCFKTEEEYVSHCKHELVQAGMTGANLASGCKCMYQKGRNAAEQRGEYETSDAEAEVFFDECLG